MTRQESLLLQVIDTGPTEIREIVSCGPDLINPELPAKAVKPSDILNLVDRLDGQRLIGRTGSQRETIVISRLGREALATPL